jgi:excinuclease ABC subunit C
VVRRLPAEPGVYRFRDRSGRVLYVGRATELRSRVGSYWSDLRGRRHLTRMVAQVARVEAVACASVHEAAWLERNLLQASMPRWNRTPGGQENQVYIRLSRPRAGRATRAGRVLAVVYAASPAPDVQYFGPYLGGVRTRQAVSALCRIRPGAGAGPAARGAHQAEAEALDWVTGPQRVTSMDPGDLDVYGWAEFAVRNAELAAQLAG